MDLHKTKKLLLKTAAIYILLAALIFIAAGDGFRTQSVTGAMLTPTSVIGEIVDGTVVSQRIMINADCAEELNIELATFGRANTGTLVIDILAEDGSVLASLKADAAGMQDNAVMSFPIPGGICGRKGQYVTLQLRSEGCTPGNAVTVYYGSSVHAGRYDIAKAIDDGDLYHVNGAAGSGTLCAYFEGHDELVFYKLYWPLVLLLLAFAAAAVRVWWVQAGKGRKNPLTVYSELVFRYGFLMRQLITRDFKTRYKRSVLGVGWSVLNPVLTMIVQYVIFSTIFSDGTKNYPVYLLTGIVIFSFFNEAVTMGMASITSNAALIKKVYMPKYIYPVSRVFSSLINLVASMVPLIGAMLVTGLLPKLSFLLLVYDFLCLILFVIGMVLLLSTSMTFFQDTQFLWGVVSMTWMYLTPIFYTDTIIPDRFLTLFHMNPLYQFINFARICIIDGVTPPPVDYLWCLLPAVLALAAGTAVFRRNQNRFVLYL